MNSENLKAELKQKLNITWDDADTESKLSTIIADAEKILNFKLGAEIDYSAPGMEHNLFLNYCMYSWNNCTNDFDKNYLAELSQTRRIYEVKNYVAKAEQLQ